MLNGFFDGQKKSGPKLPGSRKAEISRLIAQSGPKSVFGQSLAQVPPPKQKRPKGAQQAEDRSKGISQAAKQKQRQGSLPNVMARLDKMFGKRPGWNQGERSSVSRWLWTEQKAGPLPINGLEELSVTEIWDQYSIDDLTFNGAVSRIGAGAFDQMDRDHAQFAERKQQELNRRRVMSQLIEQGEAQVEQERQNLSDLTEGIESGEVEVPQLSQGQKDVINRGQSIGVPPRDPLGREPREVTIEPSPIFRFGNIGLGSKADLGAEPVTFELAPGATEAQARANAESVFADQIRRAEAVQRAKPAGQLQAELDDIRDTVSDWLKVAGVTLPAGAPRDLAASLVGEAVVGIPRIVPGIQQLADDSATLAMRVSGGVDILFGAADIVGAGAGVKSAVNVSAKAVRKVLDKSKDIAKVLKTSGIENADEVAEAVSKAVKNTSDDELQTVIDAKRSASDVGEQGARTDVGAEQVSTVADDAVKAADALEPGATPGGSNIREFIARKIDDADAELASLKAERESIDFGSPLGAGAPITPGQVRLLDNAVKTGLVFSKKAALTSADWGARMVEEFGDWIEPHLDSIRGVLRSNDPDEEFKLFTGSLTEDDAPTALGSIPSRAKPSPSQSAAARQSQTTGLANQVQERELVEGVLDADPRTKGTSLEDLRAQAVDAFKKNPELDFEALSKKVADGEEFSARSFAILEEGKARLLRLKNTALDASQAAVKTGDPDVIEIARRDLDEIDDRIRQYVSNVQEGKGIWSNAGRALQIGTELDTGNLADVLLRAETTAGRRLNQKEIDALTKDSAAFKALRDELADEKRLRAQLERELEGRVPPTRLKRTVDEAVGGKQKDLDELRRDVEARISRLRPKTFFKRLNELGREAQLFNPFARAFDITSNTFKLGTNIALNPARSVLSSMFVGKTVGRETLITPTKLLNAARFARRQAPRDVRSILKGTSEETISKFGGASGISTKAAGLTDAPFNALYRGLAFDDFALTTAKGLDGNTRRLRSEIFDQLANGTKGPLSAEQVKAANNLADDWALRQTYNIDNTASRTVSAIKGPLEGLKKRAPGNRAVAEFADAMEFFVDMNARFSKVIGNVVLDAANFDPRISGVEVVGRLGLAKGTGLSAKIPAKEARLIADVASKGLTGTALVMTGASLWPELKKEGKKENPWIRGEIVTTASGFKFVEWTILPELFGGMDADQLPGAFKAVLRGATEQLVNESSLTESQKEGLLRRYEREQFFSQPLTTGPQRALDAFSGKSDLNRFLGSRTASQVIPGLSRELAQRLDESRGGTKLRKSEGFWDEFIKRIPSPPENSFAEKLRFLTREELKNNEKRSSGPPISTAASTQIKR